MDAMKLPHAYQAALFLFNGLRCFGFPSENIFFMFDPVKGMFVSVNHGGQRWSIRCGSLDLSYEGWEADWGKVTAAMLDGSLTQESLDRLWTEWEPLKEKLARDLIVGGVSIPNVERDKAAKSV